MTRRSLSRWVWLALVALSATACHPTQPFFFYEDGDLSHYLDSATEIEYPDVDNPHLSEVASTGPPLTLETMSDYEPWEVSLEEAVQTTLANSRVMRKLGGTIISQAPESLTRQEVIPGSVTTVYDPALVETGYGAATGAVQSGTGVEAALSEFDAQLSTSMFWERNDRPQNFSTGGVIGSIFTPVFVQDLGRATTDITKTTAYGTTLTLRNNTIYDLNNNPTRALPSDWTLNAEAEFRQPLLQGRGTLYNRIAGPQSFEQYASGFPNTIDGVVIARIRADQALADFEGGVRDLVFGVEDAYWNLYFAYRNFETRRVGHESAQATWKKVRALRVEGVEGGEAEKEAQARSQYYFFRAEVETALTELLRAENRLRYTMGLPMSDGRLILPSDEPTTARVKFDWHNIQSEALCRRVELRKQKWDVKKRELELIASKNHLLPRVDAVGRYRWTGLGDDLIDTNRSGLIETLPGSNAFESLTGGDFQEWQLGVQATFFFGHRRQLAQVRHHQLLLTRERVLLQETEREVVDQLGDGIRELDLQYKNAQSRYNQRVASEEEVRVATTKYEVGVVTLDLLLDAQRRLADAESAYYRSLVDYNKAIANVHVRKGSLLDYNGVYLAEGPWPKKAYFDTLRRARKRDASRYLDYGFTRPKVFSRGPVLQQSDEMMPHFEGNVPTEAGPELEEIPVPRLDRDEPAAEEIPSPTAHKSRRLNGSPDSVTQRASAGSRPRPTDARSASAAARKPGQVTRPIKQTAKQTNRASAQSSPPLPRRAPLRQTGHEQPVEDFLEGGAPQAGSERSAAKRTAKPPRPGYPGSGVRRD